MGFELKDIGIAHVSISNKSKKTTKKDIVNLLIVEG